MVFILLADSESSARHLLPIVTWLQERHQSVQLLRILGSDVRAALEACRAAHFVLAKVLPQQAVRLKRTLGPRFIMFDRYSSPLQNPLFVEERSLVVATFGSSTEEAHEELKSCLCAMRLSREALFILAVQCCQSASLPDDAVPWDRVYRFPEEGYDILPFFYVHFNNSKAILRSPF